MASISRRDAVKTLALSAGGIILSPSFLHCASQKKKDRLGVALVGLGYYSTDLLAPALQQTKNCYLAGIVTGTPSKAEAWKKKYSIPDKNIYNYDNFDTIAFGPLIAALVVGAMALSALGSGITLRRFLRI